MKKNIFLGSGIILIALLIVFFLCNFKNNNLGFDDNENLLPESSAFRGHQTWVAVYTDSSVKKDYLKKFIGYKYNPTFYGKKELDLDSKSFVDFYNRLNIPQNAIEFILLIDDIDDCGNSLESELEEKSNKNDLIYYIGITDPRCLN